MKDPRVRFLLSGLIVAVYLCAQGMDVSFVSFLLGTCYSTFELYARRSRCNPSHELCEKRSSLDPLSHLRFLVSPEERCQLDLIRSDLAEDKDEMKRLGFSPAWVALVVWWRSLTEFAGSFGRSVRKLLPTKTAGEIIGVVRHLWRPGG